MGEGAPMATHGTIEIGTPADERELVAFRRLADYAFAPNPGPVVDTGWMRRQGMESLRVARVRGKVAGGLGMLPMGQWFGGRSVPTVGVNAVAIAPEHRSTGIGSTLLLRMLEDAHERGLVLSALYPATQVVYRRAGYEQAGVAMQYQQPLHALPPRDRSLRVRPAEASDEETVRALYTERARRTAGNLDRGELFWQRLREGGESVVSQYLVERDGVPEGYVTYVQRQPPGERERNIVAHDLVALTADAGRRLLSFLADHRSTVDNVVWPGSPSEPLLLHLPNQEYKVTSYERWMLRLVEVRGALEARGYPSALDAEIHLEVRDDVLPWNAGRWVLRIGGGAAEVREGGEGRVRADVRGLAPLYSGYLSPLELRGSGYLEGAEEELEKLGLAFAGPTPWMPDGF